MLYDFTNLNPDERYKLIAQSVIPRPIAWVVTENENIINIAPFSFFNALSATPPVLVVSIGHKESGEPKDTLKNLRATKKCVLCLANVTHKEQLICTSEALDSKQSEAEFCKVETKIIDEAYPPMIADAQVAYFCELRQELDLGGKIVPLLLDVKKAFFNDVIITDKEKLRVHFDALGRVGASFAKLEEI
jgi:flavin reductase (DIM6/NTAB) family NADH-FMN oxidoreductase RutF